MKKRVLFVLCACAFNSLSALAGDIGLGVSAKSDEGFIYLPIKIGSSMIAEPYIGYHNTDHSEKPKEFGYDDGYSYSRQFYGIGLFWTHEIKDRFSAYYGLRTAYVKSSTDYISNGYSISADSISGFSVSPTLGIEYRISESFSASIEAEWNYYRYDGKQTVDTGAPEHYIERSDVVDKGQNTGTRFLIRYFF